MVEQGCRAVSWEDWAADHHPDPIRAAACVALAGARTARTAAILLDQYHGALRRAAEAIRQSLRAGDAAGAREQLQALLGRANLGRHLVEPWLVALAGPPNSGKSSLINALVGYQRAIVHPAPGTTRDVVSATTAVDGWPAALCDTAGLRDAEQAVEQAGVALAQRQLASAELILLVFDLSQPWSEADQTLVESWPQAIVVHNKCDLTPDHDPARPAGLLTSALRGQGIEQLARAIAGRLVPQPPGAGAAVPFTDGQIGHLEAAADAIAGEDLPAAMAALDRLT
jgi:tRNA modification GTPase